MTDRPDDLPGCVASLRTAIRIQQSTLRDLDKLLTRLAWRVQELEAWREGLQHPSEDPAKRQESPSACEIEGSGGVRVREGGGQRQGELDRLGRMIDREVSKIWSDFDAGRFGPAFASDLYREPSYATASEIAAAYAAKAGEPCPVCPEPAPSPVKASRIWAAASRGVSETKMCIPCSLPLFPSRSGMPASCGRCGFTEEN